MKNLQKSFIQFIIIAIISISLGGAGWYVYEVIKTGKYKNINLVSGWEVYKN